MTWKNVLSLFILISSWIPCGAFASGKVDFGPCYVNMKVLQHGKTQNTLEMYGVRGDATIQVFPGESIVRGIVIKPSGTWAEGDGNFVSTGVSLGHYTPLGFCTPFLEDVAVTPIFGVVYSRLSTWVDYAEFGLPNLKQVTSATTPYLGIDVAWQINPRWLLSGSFQYGWAAGRTHIDVLGFSKGQSTGPTCSVMLDYYITQCWSVNAAWAYNHSLTQELHGMKVNGCRIGLGYTY
ncbi:MAG: hypothetical protein Q8K75_10200 [Chlamydiales bacterium]|nr:hypothetical protein [Chlamydiales bacterium]